MSDGIASNETELKVQPLQATKKVALLSLHAQTSKQKQPNKKQRFLSQCETASDDHRQLRTEWERQSERVLPFEPEPTKMANFWDARTRPNKGIASGAVEVRSSRKDSLGHRSARAASLSSSKLS